MFDTGNSGNGYIGAAIDQVDFSSNNLSNNFVENNSNDNSINNGNEGNNNGNYSYHDYDNSNYSNDEDNSSYNNNNNNKSYNNNNNYNNKNNNKNYSFNNNNNYYYNQNNNSKKKNNNNFPFLKPIPVIKVNNNSKPKKLNNIVDFSNDNYDYNIESIKKRIYNLQNEIVRDKLYINLIFYDENVTRENKFLYDDLQLNVVGGFYGVRDLNMFNMLIKKLEKNNLPFILLTSGSVFQKKFFTN